MAVVCEKCGHASRRVLYDPPAKPTGEVRAFLAVVSGCAVLGMYHMTEILFSVLPIVDKGQELGVTSLEIPGTRLALLRDLIQLYANSTSYFLAVMLLALIAVSTRNLYMVIASARGRPDTLHGMRAVVEIQFGLEFLTTVSLLALGYHLEVIKVPFHFGYNLILAPIALAMSMRPAIRDYFSTHRLERRPGPA